MPVVEDAHGLLVGRVVGRPRRLVARQRLLHVGRQVAPQPVRLLDPERNAGRRVGDDDRLQALRDGRARTPSRACRPTTGRRPRTGRRSRARARAGDELVLEELRRPEVGGRVGQVRGSGRSRAGRRARAPAEPRELGDRLGVVVRGARAAVADDHRRRPRLAGRRRTGTTSRARPSVISPSLISCSLLARPVGGGRPRSGRSPCSSQRRPLDAADLGRIAGTADGSGSRPAGGSGSAPRPRARSAPGGTSRPRRSVSIAGIADSSASVYGWIGCGEELVRAAELDDDAEVHDRDAVGDVVDDAEVVGDEDVRQVEVVLQVVEQVDHLRLDRDVERGDRLVGDDQLRVQRQRACDADPLALPARELVRVAVDVIGRQPDHLEQLAAPARGSARADPAGGSGTGPRGSARPACAGSATRTGPGRSSASRAGTGAARRFESDVMSVPPNSTVPLVGCVQAHEQPAERRLAAARLADDRRASRRDAPRARHRRPRARRPSAPRWNAPRPDREVLRQVDAPRAGHRSRSCRSTRASREGRPHGRVEMAGVRAAGRDAFGSSSGRSSSARSDARSAARTGSPAGGASSDGGEPGIAVSRCTRVRRRAGSSRAAPRCTGAAGRGRPPPSAPPRRRCPRT